MENVAALVIRTVYVSHHLQVNIDIHSEMHRL